MLCVVEIFTPTSSNICVCRNTLAAFIPYLKPHPQESRPWCMEMQIQAVLGVRAKMSEAAPSRATPFVWKNSKGVTEAIHRLMEYVLFTATYWGNQCQRAHTHTRSRTHIHVNRHRHEYTQYIYSTPPHNSNTKFRSETWSVSFMHGRLCKYSFQQLRSGFKGNKGYHHGILPDNSNITHLLTFAIVFWQKQVWWHLVTFTVAKVTKE